MCSKYPSNNITTISTTKTEKILRNEDSYMYYTHIYTVKSVYKGHSGEPENMALIGSCLLFTG